MSAMSKVVAMLLVTLFFNGCYFTSIHSVTEHPIPNSDPALLGFWKMLPTESETTSGDNYILFLEETDGHLMIVLIENKYRFSEIYRGFISVVGKEHYLNVKAIKPDKAVAEEIVAENYHIVHYEIKDGKTLRIRMLREKLVKQAIEKKRLAGTIKKSRFTDDIQVSASSEAFIDFLASQKTTSLVESKDLLFAEKVNKLPEWIKP